MTDEKSKAEDDHLRRIFFKRIHDSVLENEALYVEKTENDILTRNITLVDLAVLCGTDGDLISL